MTRASFIRSVMAFSIAFLLLLGLFQTTIGDELEEIQKAIEAKGAKWTAGRTSISVLPHARRKLRLGAILSGEDHEGNASAEVRALPPYFDWRDVGGDNFVTSVKDQGPCGSCWAFATVGALESLKVIADGTPDPPGEEDLVDKAEQFLVSCNKRNDGCSGGYMAYAYNFVKWIGTPDEECFPYEAKDLPCYRVCREWRDTRVRITSWSWVPQNVDALKAAVYEQPVATGFYLYTDFYYYTGGVYEYVWGVREGGHAVIIFGWDDDPPDGPPCFFVKNSWGEGWGEPGPRPDLEKGGYFRIAYSQVTNKVSFGSDTGDFDTPRAMLAPPIGPRTITTMWGDMKKGT